MATRWKNKCKIKYFLWTLLCIVPAMVILSAYPHIREQSEKESRKMCIRDRDMETLKATNESLIATLDEVMKIQTEGKEKRRAAEVELNRMEGELKQKLLEIH